MCGDRAGDRHDAVHVLAAEHRIQTLLKPLQAAAFEGSKALGELLQHFVLRG